MWEVRNYLCPVELPVDPDVQAVVPHVRDLLGVGGSVEHDLLGHAAHVHL